jgi:hypothetical protein
MTDDAIFDDPIRCPACLGVVASDQRYCLECGQRLRADEPSAGLVGRPALRLPVVVAAAIALAVAGVAIAGGVTRDGSKKAATTFTHPTTAVSQPTISTLSASDTSLTTFTDTGTTVQPTTTQPTTTEQTTTTTTTTTPTCVPPIATADDWPNGRSAWTVILWSKSAVDVDWCTFVAKRAAARSAGFPAAGLLSSDDYTSLRGGYSVLFSGVYSTSASAWRAAIAARPRWPGAYARRVAL